MKLFNSQKNIYFVGKIEPHTECVNYGQNAMTISDLSDTQRFWNPGLKVNRQDHDQNQTKTKTKPKPKQKQKQKQKPKPKPKLKQNQKSIHIKIKLNPNITFKWV